MIKIYERNCILKLAFCKINGEKSEDNELPFAKPFRLRFAAEPVFFAGGKTATKRINGECTESQCWGEQNCCRYNMFIGKPINATT